MRGKIFVGAAAVFAAFCVGTVTAAADDTSTPAFQCNATVNGGAINRNVVVQNNGVCILNGVTVKGSVTVGNKSYFESNGSKISGNVIGDTTAAGGPAVSGFRGGRTPMSASDTCRAPKPA